MEPTSEKAQKSGKMNPMIVIGVLAVVAIVVYLFMPKGTNTTDTAPTVSEPNQVTESATEGMEVDGTVQTITMEAGSFYYSVPEIRAKQGDTIRIEMTAADMMHNFNIDELGVKSPLVKSGESTIIEFIASQAGEFEYYCSVGEHRTNGQVGKLIVE